MLTLPHGWALVCLRRNSRTFDNKAEKWNLSKHKNDQNIEIKMYKNIKMKMNKKCKQLN